MIKIYDSSITEEASVFSALSDDDFELNKAQIMQIRGDDERGIVTINACFYLLEADFTTDTMFQLGTIDEEIIWPASYTVIPGVEILETSIFHNGAGVPFAGTQVLDRVSITISPNGGVFAWVNTVITPSTLGGNDYVLFPINISFTKVPAVSAL